MILFTKIYCIILPAVFVFLCVIFEGTQAFSLDLVTAVIMAEENDAEYKLKKLESSAKRADGWALVSGMGPQVMVSAAVMRSRLNYMPDDIAEIEEQNLKFDDDSVNIRVNQPLLDMEKIYRARRGLCEMDIAELELRKAKEELIVQVISRYFSLLSAQNELSLAQSRLDILESQQQEALAGHGLGLGEQSNLFDIQARYETTRALAAIQEAEVVDAREALAEVLGEPVPGVLQDLAPEASFVMPAHDSNYWLEQAKEQSVDAKLDRFRSKAAKLNSMIGAGRFLPALSFFVEYERTSPENDLNGYGWERDRTDYGLKLEMELVSGGRDLAEYNAQEYRYRAAKQRLLVTRRNISRQVKSTWKLLERTLVSIQAYQKAVIANEKSMAIKEANFKEGLQPMLDLLDVQRDFFIVSNKHQNARYEYATTLIHFKQLTGQLENMNVSLMMTGQ